MAEVFDVVVIGGGPGGATTALLLARAGWSVAVVERMVFPRRKVCGEFLSAANLPLLRHLGVADEFLSLAGPDVKRVAVFAQDRQIVADMPRLHGQLNEQNGWGRALGREHLDTLLLERAALAGARIFQPWTVSRVQKDPAHVRRAGPSGPAGNLASVWMVCGRTRREIELRARVLVDAHGSWDTGQLVPQGPSGPAEAGHYVPTDCHGAPERRRPRASDLFGFKAHLRDSALPAGLMPLLAFPGGYGGMVHSDHGRVSLSCCVRRDTLEQSRRAAPTLSAGEAVLAHIFATCPAARLALRGAGVESGWRSAGPIRPGIRTTYRNGVFFVGNAAGEAHPVVAEGISMAMQAGMSLADALVSSRDLSQARAVYGAEWRRLFAWRIRVAAAIAHWAMRPAAVALTLPLLSAFPAMLTEGARTSGKVTAICSPSF